VHEPIRITTNYRVIDSEETRNKRLLCALVARAVIDYVGLKEASKKRDRRRSAEALEWMLSDAEVFGDCGVTFVAACDVIGLTPSSVRSHVLKLTKGDLDRFRHVLSQGIGAHTSNDDDDD
jgi:hypothetical protein